MYLFGYLLSWISKPLISWWVVVILVIDVVIVIWWLWWWLWLFGGAFGMWPCVDALIIFGVDAFAWMHSYIIWWCLWHDTLRGCTYGWFGDIYSLLLSLLSLILDNKVLLSFADGLLFLVFLQTDLSRWPRVMGMGNSRDCLESLKLRSLYIVKLISCWKMSSC